MLQPIFYLLARHRAQFHVQAEICSVAMPDRTPGFATVEARVERVFRGGPGLQPGDAVRFAAAVTRPDDRLPIGGIIWQSWDAVASARWAEAFLNGVPPDCEIALSQWTLLAAPTARPTLRGRFWHLALRQRLWG